MTFFLRKFTNNLIIGHLKAIEKALKYFRYTLDYERYYAGYTTILEGYSDAYSISNTKNSKSISGYVFTHSGVIVS